MKADLDRLMADRQIDVLLTLPSEHEDPYRAYLANGVDFNGLLIKKRGQPPVIIASPMEVDEAAKSGWQVHTFDDFGLGELMKAHQGNTEAVNLAWFQRVFAEFGVQGRVGVYGMAEINSAYRLLRNLTQAFGDQVEFVTEPSRQNLFDEAVQTKDEAEIARLRAVAAKTSAVVRATRDWIASHRASGDTVVAADGTPLTIGAVKRFVRGQLFEHNLEDPDGMIFAQGRDAGVPHSVGQEDQVLTLGQSIVFDLFPREPRGYFHDMTRTWSLGYATPKVQAAYDAVMEAFRRAVDMCRLDLPTSAMQKTVCEYFEELGHATPLNSPGTAEGYVHSLAHGLGLSVHEAPFFPTHGDRYRVQAGNVFTIEPGLYYPEHGYGVRIEDTLIVNAQGQLEWLTDVPYDLVIELKG